MELARLRLDNPTLQNRKAEGWPDAINLGIKVRGSQVSVHHNIVRRFRDGIQVGFSPGTGTGREYANNVISKNMVLDLLGSGSGSADIIGSPGEGQGETDGDGIVIWGAATIIEGNLVQARSGADCRAGILCEGLRDRRDPADHGALYPDQGAVISNNLILGAGLDARNGRFWWGVVIDELTEASITGNAIYGVNWSGIDIAQRGDGVAVKGNISVVGNNIVWTRPAVDLAGDAQNFFRAGISVFSAANANGATVANVSVANNNIEIRGSARVGILVWAGGDLSGLQLNIVIQGNSILAQDGGPLLWFIRTIFGIEELVIHGNTLRGRVETHALYIQRGAKRGVISNNVIRCLARTSGSVIFGDGIDAGAVDRVVIEGNVIDGGGGNGVTFQNVSSLVIDGNVLNDLGGNGVNGLQVARGVLTGNVFSNIGAAYTINWAPSATKVDANNVKN